MSTARSDEIDFEPLRIFSRNEKLSHTLSLGSEALGVPFHADFFCRQNCLSSEADCRSCSSENHLRIE